MEKQQPTPYGGNVFKQIKQTTVEGNPVTKCILASDIIFCEFGTNLEKLSSTRILQMEIRSKELDKPINPFISFIASLANIEKNHQFLLFKTGKFLITVDYYQKNRLVIRVGDQYFVLDLGKSDKKRKEAKILEEANGLLWRVTLNEGQFTVGKLFCLLMQTKMRDHSKVLFSGHHFSRQVFNHIQQDYVKK